MARVVADHDVDEDHVEEQQVGVTPPKPYRQAGCCPRHRRMKEEERPESRPIMTMVKIMK